MAVTLNERAYGHAKKLIQAEEAVLDDRDAWSEHRPSAAREDEFLERHGSGEYAKWYLGIDDEQPDDGKGRYEFPYGDFARAHRCGVLSAEVQAGQYKYVDIEAAVGRLRGMLDRLT
ncbi:hypothetical protein [Streptomyces sp. NPDC048639]|uniref:hypothetical protein n=1 Tax=Streptomyces sp. NPDC048639 TaxID=3365581 RepID=UPI003724AE55